MRLMKDWYEDGRGYARQKDAIGTLEGWYRKNLTITYGNGKNVEEIFGLPYTSSSSHAMIGNCQAEAHYKGNPQMHFHHVAITESGKYIVAVFMVYDLEGNEVGEAYVYMN